MRYLYIIILMVILAGMFAYGDHVPSSAGLLSSENNVAINSEDSFCSSEVEKYKKELFKAERQIESLNSHLIKLEKADKSLTTYFSN